MKNSGSLKNSVYISLFAALTAVGAFIAIPIGPVPIVLQNFFVILAGLILGPYIGTASILLYLFLGLCGFPIFAGGSGGIGKFLGPTGGYLIGYIPAVFIIGLISHKFKKNIIFDLAASICGCTIVYIFGLAGLTLMADLNLSKALVIGVYPFVFGDIIKITAAVLTVKRLRPVIKL